MVVDGVASPYVDVGSGLPQGSIIGPLLFLIHVSGIDFKLKYSQVASFADDTRLVMKISSPGDCTDFQKTWLLYTNGQNPIECRSMNQSLSICAIHILEWNLKAVICVQEGNLSKLNIALETLELTCAMIASL